MNGDNEPPKTRVTQDWERIDSICDAFEGAFRQDSTVRIESYLEPDDGERSSNLLRELLALEVELRNPPDETEYLRRFPNAEPLIRQVFDSQSDAAKHAGKILGEYELLGAIGRGGMGVVFKARHRSLDRIVALKTLHSGNLASNEEVERFRNEAQAAARLDHPGIVAVFEVGEVEGRHFLAMGMVEGGNLSDRIKDGPLANRNAASLAAEICEAVQYAHERNIIHRDLKPANVLLDTAGNPRLTDFGLARILDRGSQLTATGQLLGTPSYMAPEQALGDGETIGPTTDVYAIGAILYCMVTGRPPFNAPTVAETIRQVIEFPPARPQLLNPQVDRDLETICLKCLAKAPKERYASCRALHDDLKRYLDGQPISARRIGPLMRSVRLAKRRPAQTALLASLVLLAITFAAGWWFRREMLANDRQRKSAESLAAARARTLETQRYYAKFQTAQTAVETRRPGWTWESRRLIRGLEPPDDVEYKDELIRTWATAAATSFDLRPHAVIPTPGSRIPGEVKSAGCVAFSSDSEFFAVGESINGWQPTLAVYRTADFSKPYIEFKWNRIFDTLFKGIQGKSKRSDGFRSVAFSPDNRWVAVGTRFGKVLVFDLNDGAAKPKVLPVREESEVSFVGFSHDGSRLYAVAKGELVKEWEDFQETASTPCDGAVIGIHPHITQVALRSNERMHVRRTLLAQDVSYIGDGLAAPISGDYFTYTPSGEHLLVSDVDLQWFDVLGGNLAGRLARPSSQFYSDIDGSPQVTGDGRIVGLAYDDRVVFWDAFSEQKVQQLELSDSRIAFSPSGRLFAASDGDQVRVFELNALDRYLTSQEGTGKVADLDLATDGTPAVIRESGHLAGWMLYEKSGSEHASGDAFAANSDSIMRAHVAVSPDGLQTAVAVSDLGVVVNSRTEQGWRRRLLPAPRIKIAELGPAKDSDQMAAGEPGRLPISESDIPMEFANSVIAAEVLVKGPITATTQIQLGFESGASTLLSASAARMLSNKHTNLIAFGVRERKFYRDAKALVVRSKDPEVELTIQQAFVAQAPAVLDWSKPLTHIGPLMFSPDSKQLWGVVEQEYLCCWDSESLQLKSKWPALLHQSLLLDLDVGSQWVATCARNGAVQLTKADTGLYRPDAMRALSPDASLHNVDFMSDERSCIVSGDAGVVEQLAIPSGERLRVVIDLESRITAQTLSADDSVLVVGNAVGDCYVLGRSGDSYAVLLKLDSFQRPIRELKLSEDGRLLFVIVADSTRVLRLELAKLLDDLEELGRFEAASIN